MIRKKLLITGGLGFAGKHFYKSQFNKWKKIVIYDKMTYAADRAFINRYFDKKKDKIVIGDILDKRKLEKYIDKNTCVVHFAAESHVDNSFETSLIFTNTNTLGTHKLLEVCRLKKPYKIIVISTDEVYGESIKSYKNENSRLQPTNPYSASKASADLISQTYMLTFKLPICILRPNNLYGERQYVEKIIPAIINSISYKKILKIHGKGKTIRRFLHVDDLSAAIELLIKRSKSGEIYNIGGKFKIQIYELVKLCFNLSKSKMSKLCKFVKDRPFNDYDYKINDKKIKRLGWKENKNFKIEIKKLLEKKSILR